MATRPRWKPTAATTRRRPRQSTLPTLDTVKDPAESAQAAGLRYVREDLFQYVDDEGVRQTVGSGDVNDYLREVSGQEFTAKDFRTWAGTILAVAALTEVGTWASLRQAKSNVLRAIDRVAEQLNNTRAVCRKYYVHPGVFDSYLAGTMLETLQNRRKRRLYRYR